MKKQRKVAVGALLAAAAASAAMLAGGIYATTVVPLTDETGIVLADGDSSEFCTNPLTVKAGLARFDPATRAFVYRDVTISGTDQSCSGSVTTVIGTDSSGTPVAEGSAVTQTGPFTISLSNPVKPESVAHWHVAIQTNDGYAGAGVTPPPITPDSIPADPADLEPSPSATPTPATPTGGDPAPEPALDGDIPADLEAGVTPPVAPTPEPSTASTDEAAAPAPVGPSLAPDAVTPTPPVGEPDVTSPVAMENQTAAVLPPLPGFG